MGPTHLSSAQSRTPDRTLSGSYDWLRCRQGATDRQCLLRSPGAVTCSDRSLTICRTSGRAITNDLKRSMQKSRMGSKMDVKVAYKNVGTTTSKGRELAEMMAKRKV